MLVTFVSFVVTIIGVELESSLAVVLTLDGWLIVTLKSFGPEGGNAGRGSSVSWNLVELVDGDFMGTGSGAGG